MYKILVVDDDPNIRIGLSRMIQNAYPDTVITDTAENGRIAYDQVVKFHFDAVITDIKMPVWGGLELLTHLKEEYVIPPTLVLSGYDDYNLVRSSLKLGAIDYLLKPVNEGLLLNALDSIFKSLEINSLNPPALEADLKNQILLEGFFGSAPVDEEKEAFLTRSHITRDTPCRVLYVDMSHGLYSRKKIIRNFIETRFESCFPPSSSYCPIYGEIGQYWILLLFELGETARCAALTAAFLKQLEDEGLFVSASLSPLPLADLSFLKAECLRGFERYFFDLPYTADSKEWTGSEEREQTGMKQHRAAEQELLDLTTAALAEYDYAGALEHLSRLFAYFNSRRPPVAHLRRTLSNGIYDLMGRNSNFIPVVSQSSLTDYDILAQIEDASSLKELQASMFATLNFYVEKAMDSLNNKEDFVIKKAKEYIRNNYRDTITLNDVSAYVYLNPNYFSTLFKSKTGITFRQYLRDFRIQTSKELIRQGNLKVYEVADAVGYPEPAHFVRAFKEVEGISPTEYKNSL